MVRRDKKTGQIFGHNGVPDLVRLFAPYTNNVLITHFGAWFYKDTKKTRQRLKHLGKEHNLIVHVGCDGMKLNLNEL